MDGASTSTNSGMQVPQKRVLPARSRRGGPGVGNCEIDLMILDRQRRRLEYDPLIPTGTQLLLTTNPHAVEKSSSTRELGMNVHANDRYFDRPEVVKAYREQQIIQTPDFTNINENPAAMGRLRPRTSEDGTADTSDAAYEKRHRKYEAFEKRIRLREKEKLKHEQYKLKERIEQLRGMDGGAFLSLPASSFSLVPGQLDGNSEDSRARINGAAAHNEGERRRKEMLDVASYLEERYRILLPPDRFRKAPGPSNFNTPIEPEGVVYVSRDSRGYGTELNEEPLVEAGHREAEKMKQSENPKLKIRLDGKPNKGKPSKKRKRGLSPALEPASPIRANHEAAEPVSPALDAIDRTPTPALLSPSPQLEASRSATPISNPEIAVLRSNSRDVTIAPQEEEREEGSAVPPSAPSTPAPVVASSPGSSTSAVSRASGSPEPAPAPRGRKRIKLSSPLPSSPSRKTTRATSVPPIESIPASVPRRVVRTQKQSPRHVSYAGIAGRAERTNSLLMVSASRKSDGSVRKTERHISIFGMKIRHDLIVKDKDYVLPSWVLPASDPREVS